MLSLLKWVFGKNPKRYSPQMAKSKHFEVLMQMVNYDFEQK